LIKCFCGVPGSGKSYDAVQTILDAVKLGRKIYTNIEGFDDPECQEFQKLYCNLTDFQLATSVVSLSKEQVFKFWEVVPSGALIVIDEIQMNFSNRDWNSEENRGFVKWAEMHRHYGNDLIMLTHSTEKVDKHVRSLIDWTYVYDKVNYFGSLVKGRYTKNAFKFDQDKGKAIKSNVCKYDPAVFPCYKSYVSDDIKEMGIGQGINVLKHPIFLVIPVVFILFLYLLFYKSSLGSGDLFGQKHFKQVQAALLDKSSDNSKKSPVEFITHEYRDLSVDISDIKKNPLKPAVLPAGVLPGGPSNPLNNRGRTMSTVNLSPEIETDGVHCTVTGVIDDGIDKIEISRCGCVEVKKKNNIMVYQKNLSPSRCSGGTTSPSDSSLAVAGAAPRRGRPPVL